MKNLLKKFNFLKTMRLRLFFIVLLLVTLNMVSSYLLIKNSITNIVYTMIGDQLNSEITALFDSEKYTGWYINEDGMLCNGDTVFGDGEFENANNEHFIEFQRKYSTLSYVFLFDRQHDAVYVPENGVKKGYYEGNFKRVAGSTLSPKGESLIGTYVEKQVSDALINNKTFKGPANVGGGLIYCIYNTISDSKGEIIGAMVVGKNISELHAQINNFLRNIIYLLTLITVIILLILNAVISIWLKNIENINVFLKQLSHKEIPDVPLTVLTSDEFAQIAKNINDMTLVFKENIRLQKKSVTDPLTGLGNRFGLEAEFESIIEKCANNNYSLSFEMIDVDYFKQYNDNYGHKEGDLCLLAIANILKKIREAYPCSYCARFGGDEFVILYYNYSMDEVRNAQAQIKDLIEKENISHKYSQVSDKVTLTQGAAYFETVAKGTSIGMLLQNADSVLYKIKKAGRNGYAIENFGSIQN